MRWVSKTSCCDSESNILVVGSPLLGRMKVRMGVESTAEQPSGAHISELIWSACTNTPQGVEIGVSGDKWIPRNAVSIHPSKRSPLMPLRSFLKLPTATSIKE